MPSQRSTTSVKLLGLACVFLLLMGAVVQVAHVHPSGSISTTHNCAVCVVAAGSIDIASIPHIELIHLVSLQIQSQEISPYTGFIAFSLTIRPPPSA